MVQLNEILKLLYEDFIDFLLFMAVLITALYKNGAEGLVVGILLSFIKTSLL